MTQTIKEHLAVIREALWLAVIREALWYARAHESEYGEFKAPASRAAFEATKAIEAKLSAPMKSAEEWGKDFVNHFGDSDFGCPKCFDIIRAIQADAIASKLPDVDLRELAHTVMLQTFSECVSRDGIDETRKNVEYIIHGALLKARGGEI